MREESRGIRNRESVILEIISKGEYGKKYSLIIVPFFLLERKVRLGKSKILITKRGINFIKVSRGFNYATLKFLSLPPPFPIPRFSSSWNEEVSKMEKAAVWTRCFVNAHENNGGAQRREKEMHRPKNIARAAIIFGVSWETWTLAIRDDKNGARYRDKTS